MAAKKKTVTFPLILIVLALVLVGSFAYYKYNYAKQATEKANMAQPVVEEAGHPGYEEPVERKELWVIDIEENGELKPETLTVKTKEVIAFKNESAVEQVVVSETDTTVVGGFAIQVLKPGEQLYLAQFSKAGVYTYYLKSNPQKKGKIVVE